MHQGPQVPSRRPSAHPQVNFAATAPLLTMVKVPPQQSNQKRSASPPQWNQPMNQPPTAHTKLAHIGRSTGRSNQKWGGFTTQKNANYSW